MILASLLVGLVWGCGDDGTADGGPPDDGPPDDSAQAGATGGGPSLSLTSFDAVWDIIHETHYDTTFGGVDWEAQRDRFRPLVFADSSHTNFIQVVEQLLETLGESHFALIPGASRVDLDLGSGGDLSGTFGLEIRRIDGVAHVYRVSGPAAETPIRTGWIIDGVDAHLFKTLLADLDDPALSRGRRELTAWFRLMGTLDGPVGSEGVVLLRDRKDQSRQIRMKRGPREGQPVTFGNLPTLHATFEHARRFTPSGAAAGCLGFNFWMVPNATAFDGAMDSLRTSDGIIIDLRGNFGGLAGMITGISGHFFEERASLGTVITRDSSLDLFANPRVVNAAGERVQPFAGPVAILIDEHSYSASEFFAGGMQAAGRARVFGRRSLGGVLAATLDKLPNGDVLEHAIADFRTPDGRRLEGKGVIPDVEVPLTQKDLLAGRDLALKAALAWIDEELARE